MDTMEIDDSNDINDNNTKLWQTSVENLTFEDACALLAFDIEDDITHSEAKRSHRRISLREHPDKSEHPMAIHRCQLVNAARDLILQQLDYQLIGFDSIPKAKIDDPYACWCYGSTGGAFGGGFSQGNTGGPFGGGFNHSTTGGPFGGGFSQGTTGGPFGGGFSQGTTGGQSGGGFNYGGGGFKYDPRSTGFGGGGFNYASQNSKPTGGFQYTSENSNSSGPFGGGGFSYTPQNNDSDATGGFQYTSENSNSSGPFGGGGFSYTPQNNDNDATGGFHYTSENTNASAPFGGQGFSYTPQDTADDSSDDGSYCGYPFSNGFAYAANSNGNVKGSGGVGASFNDDANYDSSDDVSTFSYAATSYDDDNCIPSFGGSTSSSSIDCNGFTFRAEDSSDETFSSQTSSSGLFYADDSVEEFGVSIDEYNPVTDGGSGLQSDGQTFDPGFYEYGEEEDSDFSSLTEEYDSFSESYNSSETPVEDISSYNDSCEIPFKIIDEDEPARVDGIPVTASTEVAEAEDNDDSNKNLFQVLGFGILTLSMGIYLYAAADDAPKNLFHVGFGILWGVAASSMFNSKLDLTNKEMLS